MEGGKSVDTYFSGKNPYGASYTVRAPLFYFALNFFNNKVLGCWWLNVLSFCTSLLLIFRIARSMGLTYLLSYTCVVASAMSYPWLQNHFFLWSEPLFSVFIFLLIVSLMENKPLTLIVGICIVLFFLRKTGVFLVAGTGIYYLMTKDFRKFLILSLILTVVITGLEFFSIYKAKTSASLENLRFLSALDRSHYADVITSWIVPRFMPLLWRIILISSVIIIIGVVYAKEVQDVFYQQKARVVLMLFLVYLCCITVLTGVPEYMEAERYLSVMLPLLVLILFSFCNTIKNSGTGKRKLFYSGISLWVLYTFTRSVSHFL
jgi:hypothetical protein